MTKTANHSLAVTLQTGGQHRGRASMRMQRGYEFMEAEETNSIDMAAKMILKPLGPNSLLRIILTHRYAFNQCTKCM